MKNSEIITQLCSLRNHGSKFGIDRMRILSEAIGAPQQHFKSIHIAGTNGKGSTAAMIEAILRKEGFKTGLYTSPHLVKLGERIQVNRHPLSDTQICTYTQELYAKATQFGQIGDEDYPSFFEFMTAMAFLHFARENCDFAIVETGLGGRLDATNILAPELCIITSIALDHCEILGNSIEKIAAEKAGIIKANTPIILGHVPAEAEKIIREIAAQKNAPLYSVREHFQDAIENYPQSSLLGDHQRHNAGTALLACELLLRKKIQKLPPVNWPARWDTRNLDDGRELIIDVSHNPECAKTLNALLQNYTAQKKSKPIFIAGVLGIERAQAIIETIAAYASKIILVRPKQERSCSIEELKSCLPKNFEGELLSAEIKELFPRANHCAFPSPKHESIIVTGSCYLAGEVLSALAGHIDESESNLQDKILIPPHTKTL